MSYEELRGVATPAGPAGAVEASARTKFNEQGQVVDEVENRWNHETHTVYSYQDGRLVKMETTSARAKNAAWSYWTYDGRAKLTEYRHGSGAAIENHELGFHYDDRGRLLGYEYRQAADDKPFSRTEISYSNDGRRTITYR